MPEVSICLTTYNRGGVLSETIESILTQTFSDFELIISDDNSPDNTKEICEAYSAKDARVKYFRNAQNLKMPGNLNNAISKAIGKYVANLHDGDIYQPQLIQKWKEALDQYPEALFVFNGYVIETNKGASIRYVHPEFKPINTGRVLMEYHVANFSAAPWGTVMTRREAYSKYGMFNGDYGFISDVEMWLRLGTHGPVAYVPEHLITLTPREKTHPYFYPHWNVVRTNFKIIKDYYHIYQMPLSDINELNKRIRKSVFYNFLILLKHRKWARVREGVGLMQKSPVLWMRVLTYFFPASAIPVQGFDADQFWDDITISDLPINR